MPRAVRLLSFVVLGAAFGGCATIGPGPRPDPPAQEARSVRLQAPAGSLVGGPDGSPVGTLVADWVDLGSLPAVDRAAVEEGRFVGEPGRPPSVEEEAASLRAASYLLAPSPAVQILGETIEPASRALVAEVDFDGPDGLDNLGISVPPDPELAVGPNHVVAVVNKVFAIYDKSGTLLAGPTPFDNFFASLGCSGTFDPNVLYDEESGRFFLGIDSNGGTAYCFAGSQTPDPTGPWWIYRLTTASGGNFFDNPHAGVGDEVIVMGATVFFSGSYFEAQVWAFDKASLFTGTLASVAHQVLFGSTAPQPVHLHGFAQGTWPTTDVHTILATSVFDPSTLVVWTWEDPYGTDVLTLVDNLSLYAASGVDAGVPLNFPQAGGGDIRGNDARIQDAEYRDGHVWTVQTIACNPGAGSVNCIRWAEIDPSVPTILQSGVFGSDGEFRSFADLAVNLCGDMIVGYTKSSSSTYPGIFYTGRRSADPPATVQDEAEMEPGQIAYTAIDSPPYRWGDYTGATIDPDGERVWYIGEYSKDTGSTSARWGTRIGVFSFGCGASVFEDGFESGTTAAWSSTFP